jgi:hypothetical protein
VEYLEGNKKSAGQPTDFLFFYFAANEEITPQPLVRDVGQSVGFLIGKHASSTHAYRRSAA